MMCRITGLVLAAAMLVGAEGSGAAGKALLIELPDGVLPAAVSSNLTVVGGLATGGGFYWMPTTGVVYLGGIQALTVSRDGSAIAGEAFDDARRENAAVWQRAAEWRPLGSITPTAKPCDSALSVALDSSADGKVLVGLAWDGCTIARAFRWEEATGMVNLGSTVADRSTRANAVSGDGTVVVGWQELTIGFWQGARWGADGRQTLYTGPDGWVGQAWAANTDASVVVGQVCRPATVADQSAWIWTTRGGLECLAVPRLRAAREGSFLGRAQATSEDGRIIGGGHAFGPESEAVVWIDKQPYYLKDYLKQNGVPGAFDGWVNTGTIEDISRDGRMMVGWGAGPRDFKGYVVILPGGER